MKTEVRKEHGDWIVFVDDNPVFSFMYREEADKVRDLVDALAYVIEAMREDEFEPNKKTNDAFFKAKDALKDIGAI